MEMNSVLWWTKDFESKFESDKGYSIRRCLLLLLNKKNGWAQSTVAYGESFTSSNSSLAARCNADYRAVLQLSYTEYLSAHVAWSKRRGVAYSSQTGDNLPLDVVRSFPHFF